MSYITFDHLTNILYLKSNINTKISYGYSSENCHSQPSHRQRSWQLWSMQIFGRFLQTQTNIGICISLYKYLDTTHATSTKTPALFVHSSVDPDKTAQGIHMLLFPWLILLMTRQLDQEKWSNSHFNGGWKVLHSMLWVVVGWIGRTRWLANDNLIFLDCVRAVLEKILYEKY